MPAKKAKPIDLTSRDHYYFGRQTKIQGELYRLFVQRHKIPVETLIECLEVFRERESTVELLHGRGSILKHTKLWWEKFLGVVTEKTGKTFRKNPNARRYGDGYNEWWDECNLDGSFAYNGVTDDF